MEEPSLDSIVDAFRHGEFLRRSAGVRTASAEEVYGAIAHYLANDAEVCLPDPPKREVGARRRTAASESSREMMRARDEWLTS
jgi:hypothetical protein